MQENVPLGILSMVKGRIYQSNLEGSSHPNLLMKVL